MVDAPVFRPTPSEFASFPRYIRTVVEPQCQAIGLCKIVPPAAWVARASGYDDVAFDIHTPLSQHVAGKKGVFNVDLVERKSMTLDAFKALAAAKDTIAHLLDDDDAIERTFWKGLRPTMEPPVYGADLVGSLFQDDAKSNPWNVNNLDTILRSVDLPGVTQAMLYFGMWRAMFALHTEDMDLYSINFLHTGRPKFWYGIPPQSGTTMLDANDHMNHVVAAKLERVAQSLFPEKDMTCHQFLRHKTSMIAPSKLREHRVPFVKVVQRPGEFVITFPGSYHQGFNMGYNIAESVNFATLRWVGLGRAAKLCHCVPGQVRIDLDAFVHNIFSSPSSDRLDADAWVLHCSCGVYASSADDSSEHDTPSFECSKCNVWAHLACEHPTLPSDAIPSTLLCRYCQAGIIDKDHAPPSPRGLPKRLCKKNAIISLRRSPDMVVEGKVVAVDGAFLRVRVKGCSADEWLRANDPSILSGQAPPTAKRSQSSAAASPAKRRRSLA